MRMYPGTGISCFHSSPPQYLVSDTENSSFHEAQIVSAAFACSSVVYDEKAQPSTAGFSFERLGYVPASMTGTTKATGCWKVNQLAKSNPYAPLLIIAVRGTASTGKESIVDNMVNLNGEQKDASFFSVSHWTQMSYHNQRVLLIYCNRD